MRLTTIILTFSVAISTMAQTYTTDEFGRVVTDVPYQTSFDNTYNEYDGSSYLPIGWQCVGDNPFYTASSPDVPAESGSYYAISVNNSVAVRNDKLYSVFYNMEAGRTYTIDFHLWNTGANTSTIAPDGFADEEFRHSKFVLTVGTEQDYEFHTTTLCKVDEPTKGWQKVHAEFTPTESGAYCLCFAFNSDKTYTGDVAIDELLVSYENAVLHPTADFSYSGLFNLMDGHFVSTSDAKVEFRALTTNATSLQWTIKDSSGKQICTCEGETALVQFPCTEDYTITLTASNEKYSLECSKVVVIDVVDPGESSYMPLQTYGDGSTVSYDGNYTPTIGTDLYDFVSGPNHYYHRLAEKVTLPGGSTLSMQTLNYFLYSCTLASVVSGTLESNKPFTLTIYGEKDGLPDESNVVYRKSMRMGEAFSTNTSGIGGPRGMSLALSGQVSGTFFIAFEFSDDLTLDTNGGNRTHVEMMANTHQDRQSTLYYYSNALQGWYKIDNINDGLAGTGLNLIVWGTLTAASASEGIAFTPNSQMVRPVVFDIQGRPVTVSASQGLYISEGKKYIRR